MCDTLKVNAFQLMQILDTSMSIIRCIIKYLVAWRVI